MTAQTTMTDRELLELAAKAAGMPCLVWGDKYMVGDTEVDCTDLPYVPSDSPDEAPAYWNPLTDDGDALRLAVKLRIRFWIEGGTETENFVRWTVATHAGREVFETHSDHADSCAATRRAIVRAAAEIGKAMT